MTNSNVVTASGNTTGNPAPKQDGADVKNPAVVPMPPATPAAAPASGK